MSNEDNCCFLVPRAHKGVWEMVCAIDNTECNRNWEKYKECPTYNRTINAIAITVISTER